MVFPWKRALKSGVIFGRDSLKFWWMNSANQYSFEEVVSGLLAGDFSRMEPMFKSGANGDSCQIVKWCEEGRFENEREALDEAFSNACFLGHTEVVEYLLSRGVTPPGGAKTGLNGFHWAANRGQMEVVKILIRAKAPMETRNSYGGTVLGCTVWSAVHEPRAGQIEVIEELAKAGARIEEAEFPSGNAAVDEILKRHGA